MTKRPTSHRNSYTADLAKVSIIVFSRVETNDCNNLMSTRTNDVDILGCVRGGSPLPVYILEILVHFATCKYVRQSATPLPNYFLSFSLNL